MNIVLVMPPYKITEQFGMPYPVGLGYIGTVLKTNGYNVRIIDCDAMKIGHKELRDILLMEKPDVVGVTATSYTRFSAIKVVNMAKSILPDTCIIVGGPHFTATAEDALTVVKNIDFMVRGEGENTILELLAALKNKTDLGQIDGLSFRRDGKIIHNKNRQPIKGLDLIPMLDRDLVPNGKYFEKLPYSNIECKSILASRGCPFNCAFCFLHEREYRRRSNSGILDEAEYLIDRYKINAIRFFDLTFTLLETNVEDFCHQIKKRKLNFLWYCESRVDIDYNLLEIMKDAGCYSIDFALESASKKVLKQVNKKIVPEQALAFAKKCKELGIKTKVFLMLSLPGEEKYDAEETYNFACELSKYVSAFGLQVTQIIPGTEVEYRAKALGLLNKDFSWNSPYKSIKSKIFADTDIVPLYIEKLSFEEIADLYRKYSVFDIYNFEKISLNSLKRKLWKGLTNWDKGLVFKLKWLIIFIKVWFMRIFKKPHKK